MKHPRDYYPPEYLAEVQAREQRVKQDSKMKTSVTPRETGTVRRLPSGCLLYQLEWNHDTHSH